MASGGQIFRDLHEISPYIKNIFDVMSMLVIFISLITNSRTIFRDYRLRKLKKNRNKSNSPPAAPTPLPIASPEPKSSTHSSGKARFDQVKQTKIFISYRRSDSGDISGRIYDRLALHFGSRQVFKDVDSIPLGSNFKRQLDLEVSNCTVFLAVIGPNWVGDTENQSNASIFSESDFVRLETEAALNRKIPIIPLFVRGAKFPLNVPLPDSLKEIVFQNGMPVRQDPDFHNDLDRLIRALDTK